MPNSFFSQVLKCLLLFTLFDFISSNELCTAASDCNSNSYCSEGFCLHKSVLPLSPRDILGFIFLMLGSALSNAGGIGGGSLFVPILMIVLGFYTHEAIPISKLMIFVGSLTAFILNQKLRHPCRNCISLDYNIVIIKVPMLLFGTMIGVTINKVLPSIVIIIVLTLALCINSFKSLRMGIRQYQKENERMLLGEKRRQSIELSSNAHLDDSREKEGHLVEEKTKKNQVEMELQKDQRLFRWDKWKYIILSYLGMFLLSFLQEFEYTIGYAIVKRCSVFYWMIYLIYLLFAFLVTYFISRHVQNEYLHRLEIGFPYESHDIMWKKEMVAQVSLYGFLCGAIAGMVGIGGGLVIGPLLLGMGVVPTVSTVTTNFLVLFTSSSTTLQFFLKGMMNFSYGTVCLIFSVVGSFIGTVTIHYFLVISKRESVLVFALALVLAFSSLLLPTTSIIDAYQQFNKGANVLEFTSPC